MSWCRPSGSTLVSPPSLQSWVSEIEIHSIHLVAYPRSSIYTPWTLKSNILRWSYDLFTTHRRSSILLPPFWHNFRFSSVSPALNSEISIHSNHLVFYPRSFKLPPWTLKSDIIRRNYDLFTTCRRSSVLLPSFWHQCSFSPVSPARISEISIHSTHLVAYCQSFQLSPWTLKPDIVRQSYDIFTIGRCSSVLLPSFWHHFSFSPVSPALNLEILIHSNHLLAYPRSFNLTPWTLKSNIVGRSNDVFTTGRRSSLLVPSFWHQSSFSPISLDLEGAMTFLLQAMALLSCCPPSGTNLDFSPSLQLWI
jgi:hypothetical protein